MKKTTINRTMLFICFILLTTNLFATGEVRLQDDFYTAINKEWLASAEIEPGHADFSNFTLAQQQVKNTLKRIVADLEAQEAQFKQTSIEQKILNLYHNYLNLEKRNEEGIAPIASLLEAVEAVETITDFVELMNQSEMQPFQRLYGVEVGPDMKDSNQNVVTLTSTSLHLKDADHYKYPNELSKTKKEATTTYLRTLFELAGYTSQEAKEKITNIFKLEEKLAFVMVGTREFTRDSSIYEQLYNVYTLEELDTLAPNLQLKTSFKALGMQKAKRITLEEPNWLKLLNNLYTEENLPLLKDYTTSIILDVASNYLSEPFVEAGKAYRQALYGIEGDVPLEEEAISLVNLAFDSEMGKRYVKESCSEAANNDVGAMAKKMSKQ